MISIVALRTGWVKIFIRFFIICLLEQDVCSYPGIFQFLIVFDRRGRDVDVDTADRSVFMLDAVNRLNAFQYIFDGVIDGVLACFQCQTLMPHILQRNYFLLNFFLRQFFSCNMFIF